MEKIDEDDSDYIKEQEKIVQALTKIIGEPDKDLVHHSLIPIYMGGGPDVFQFSDPDSGAVMYCTAGLTMSSVEQSPNRFGNYELAIVTPKAEDWAPGILTQLGMYSLQAVLQSGATMDMSGALPDNTQITSMGFFEYTDESNRFDIDGRPCGILLCQGMTNAELTAMRSKDIEVRKKLAAAMEEANLWPFTDLQRKSVI